MQSIDLLDASLVDAPTYREFLGAALRVSKERQPNFSLGSFAARAGLGSRGFLLEVIQGKKRLTLRSAPKVAQGLRLKGKLKTLFSLLLEETEPEFRRPQFSPARQADKLRQIRASLRADLARGGETQTLKPKSFLSHPAILPLYACLGSIETGARPEEVSQRANFPLPATKSLLQKMRDEGLAEELPNGNFRAVQSHVVLERMGKEVDFRHLFVDSLRRVREEAAKDFSSQEKLFLQAVATVDKNRLPELKIKLREVLSEFIHGHQAEEGDHLAHFHVSFF